MSEILSLNNGISLIKDHFEFMQQNKDKPHKKSEKLESDKITQKRDFLKGLTYQNPAELNKKDRIDPVKRPIKIDQSKNIFYINHQGKNKAVKVEEGEYTLDELSSILQKKVNEEFGMGSIKVDLTGSGYDRLVNAEDKNIFDFLNDNNNWAKQRG